MDKIFAIALEIGFISLLGLVYYLYQKRKIGYYVAKEFELLNLELLETVTLNISIVENSPEDTEKISQCCKFLEDSTITIDSLNTIKNVFKENEDIQVLSNHILDILNDKPMRPKK
jgi:hypothetical protein